MKDTEQIIQAFAFTLLKLTEEDILDMLEEIFPNDKTSQEEFFILIQEAKQDCKDKLVQENNNE